VIHNPTAGGWLRRRRFARVIAALGELGCHVTVRRTEARGDAERFARDARQDAVDLVVAAGGDGTINEVINGLISSGLPLGVIPLGTANVFATEIGLSLAPRAVAATLARGAPAPIHVGRVNGRVFSLMAGAGFDALVVESVDARLKHLCGKCAYVYESLVRMARWRARRYVVTVDGRRAEAASVVIANGRYYAGRYVLAPEARLSAPSFQVVLFRASGRWAVIRYGLALLLNRIPRLSDVTIVEGTEVEVAGPADEPVQGDGDVVARLPLRIALAEEPLFVVGAPQAPATVIPSTRKVGASVP
jgi:YegS/Rv2252/BmrU family lipid kinase